MNMRIEHRENDRGAVLITVLLIVAVMSTVAVALVDDIRFGIRRASNVSAITQATWYAISSEKIAIQALNQTFALSPEKTSLDQPWATANSRFPVEGGYIDGQLKDATNCFNVNSLVERTDGIDLIRNNVRGLEFRRLLTALGASPADAEEMTSALTDWIDSDSRPNSRGAEDFDYAVARPAYRTPNTLIADITELRAIKGFNKPEFLNQLFEFICALPTTDPAILNLNTLTPEEAPLITALFSGRADFRPVAVLLAERSSAGYGRVQDFWENPVFEDEQIDDPVRARTGLKSAYFTLNTGVVYGDIFQPMVSFIAIGDDSAYVVSRQFGEQE